MSFGPERQTWEKYINLKTNVGFLGHYGHFDPAGLQKLPSFSFPTKLTHLFNLVVIESVNYEWWTKWKCQLHFILLKLFEY